MEHPRNHMETIIKPFKTKDTANPDRKLTKDTINQDTRQDRHMDNLLTRTNKQTELNIVYSRYYRTETNSGSS